MKPTFLLYVVLSLSPAFAHAEELLPSPASRQRLVHQLALEMERLDGEALLVRGNRPRGFGSIVEQLGKEAYDAQSWAELKRVFSRLDHAYPNLHSNFHSGQWFPSQKSTRPLIRFDASWLSPEKTEFRVSFVENKNFFSAFIPAVGDRVMAINGKPMDYWSQLNFELCKWPLRQQCDLELFSALMGERLDWKKGDPLAFTLDQGGRQETVEVPFAAAASRPDSGDQSCVVDRDLYPGFQMVHGGLWACLFRKIDDPQAAILRISSFWYGDKTQKFQSMREEVEALWPWWEKNAGAISHLILDVADNHGGNSPMPYYEILFERPYQEQWARFKKIAELDDPGLRKSFFWEEEGQEIWFQNMKKEGIWDATPWGDFLPPVPMFCAAHDRDCREGLFSVRAHPFRGRVSLLTNYFCVSSCDGFAYAVKKELGSRVKVVGQPQAADSAYSRATINVLPAGNGFRLEVVPIRHESSAQALFSQTVVITRSVEQDGTVVSGKPLAMDHFIPSRFDQGDREWRAFAIEEILSR